jgi:His-Xaa-Ser system radical SAM maturase HxsB
MKFLGMDAFKGDEYRLLPFRFRRLPWDPNRVFASSLSGQWTILPHRDLASCIQRDKAEPAGLDDLESCGMLVRDPANHSFAPLLSQLKTRLQHLTRGPQLHLFVVSLRCDHSCGYCQVSRQQVHSKQFDMSSGTAAAAVTRLFEWPSRQLTVEFQGGEPLLAFDRIREIVEAVEHRNLSEKRQVRFVIASTLHHLDDERLAFCHSHGIDLSTSLDGPADLHNKNRPLPTRDSHARTIAGIAKARSTLGHDRVAALTTLTRASLEQPEAIIDEYVGMGFSSIFLRPLSPYGFARRTGALASYTVAEFLTFYRRAIAHLVRRNAEGAFLEEVYASMILRMLLTPHAHGYVDLRSPTGAGLGAIVYNYDGKVYPSDEARMLAAMGDEAFCLGTVEQDAATWFSSPAMQKILAHGVAESRPGCTDCAYLPYCGSDPIDRYARQGNVDGNILGSAFCRRHLGLFDFFVELLDRGDALTRQVLESWAFRRGRAELVPRVEAA